MTSPAVWRSWTLAALAEPSLAGLDEDLELGAIEAVAIRFADRFAPHDREYDFVVTDREQQGERPVWHDGVRAALAALRSERLVGKGGLTAKGRQVAQALDESALTPDPLSAEPLEQQRPSAGRQPVQAPPGVIAAPLRNLKKKGTTEAAQAGTEQTRVMAELNLQYGPGADAAFERLEVLWRLVTGGRQPMRLTRQYASGPLSMNEMDRLVAADAAPQRWTARSLYRIWPDFPVQLHIDRSRVTVKADAARRTFNAHGDGIVWAVIDTGIWDGHPHFAGNSTLTHESVKDLHRAFPLDGPPTRDGALVDEDGHGTHVAGIIAGGIEPWLAANSKGSVRALETRANPKNANEPLRVPRQISDHSMLAGMAPQARLVSLKAVDGHGSLDDRVSRLICALEYVREVNGDTVEGMRIHGVNLSVGYGFDPKWYACGESPLCREVDKLVRSGVVVVVAAGNSGFGTLNVAEDAPNTFGFSMTINDPGNAERAITVGATHRDSPHTYGVSYFSSKGPTGDGRNKPDLVAPGEAITSCAAGSNLTAVMPGAPDRDTAVYVEESGTSMAAPHVSGVVACLLSVNREFVGRPEVVKQVLLDAATPLGRHTDFQGRGLVNLLGALESI